jgi:hypothetical protein
VLKAHHSRGDRNAALALDRHQSERARRRSPRGFTRQPAGSPRRTAATSRSRLLAGVGVRDDRKGAPACNLVGQGAHQSVSAVAGMRAVSVEQSRCAGVA